ncbi:MAG: M23 family metallopeptidase [Acidobacteriota bacterium]|nr:M23 family metallopeptidase [Acidobacteriota bacterium]
MYLTNFTAAPLSLNRIEVLDADAENAAPIATFNKEQLETMLQPLGKHGSAPEDKMVLTGGQSAIVFVSVATDRKFHLPSRVLHRLSTDGATLEGAAIRTHQTNLHLFGPPLEGAGWLADDGPGNDENNHHRRGVVVMDGHPVDSRRYAIDWTNVKDGASFSGDARDVHSYHSYGKTVLAVADGLVITAKDGLPDNVPGHGEAFHPAVPITLETIAGNTITIDLGGGQFAYYMHLQPNSLRVKAGDRVRRGQVLACIGASGDAREPHLHFELTTSPKVIRGEGIPYLLNRYRSKSNVNASVEVHTDDLPLDKDLVEFEKEPVK